MMYAYIIYYNSVQVGFTQSMVRKLKAEIKKKPDAALLAKYWEGKKHSSLSKAMVNYSEEEQFLW